MKLVWSLVACYAAMIVVSIVYFATTNGRNKTMDDYMSIPMIVPLLIKDIAVYAFDETVSFVIMIVRETVDAVVCVLRPLDYVMRTLASYYIKFVSAITDTIVRVLGTVLNYVEHIVRAAISFVMNSEVFRVLARFANTTVELVKYTLMEFAVVLVRTLKDVLLLIKYVVWDYFLENVLHVISVVCDCLNTVLISCLRHMSIVIRAAFEPLLELHDIISEIVHDALTRLMNTAARVAAHVFWEYAFPLLCFLGRGFYSLVDKARVVFAFVYVRYSIVYGDITVPINNCIQIVYPKLELIVNAVTAHYDVVRDRLIEVLQRWTV
jgi:hypothetical protein